MHLLGQFQPISNRACSFHQAKSGPANLHKDPELSHIESDWKPDASARADSVAASPSQIGNPTRQRGRIQLPLLPRRLETRRVSEGGFSCRFLLAGQRNANQAIRRHYL